MDFSKLESFILEKMAETRIPGLSIAIVKNSETIYARGFGFRDISKGLSATPYTVYGIGSITKSFTALSIVKLYEEGRLDLEDPVERYVSIKLKPFGKTVTVHHLLTHSCGLPATAYAEAFIRGVLGLDTTWLPISSPDDIITYLSQAEEWVVAEPGKRFFYLNEGYAILGQIISKVSGMRYEDYVKKYILNPLSMSRTYFSQDEVSREHDFATPYIVDKDGRHIESKFPFGITADGGLLSNAMDMSRYIAMFINRGELGGVRIVSREGVELMERKYIDVPWRLLGDEGYGYGLIVSENFFGRKLISHGGSVLVHTAYMAYLPQDKLGVIVLANASGYPLQNIGLYALSMMLNHDPEKELDFIFRERILKKLEGVYEGYRGSIKYSVKRMGDFIGLVYSDRYREYTTIMIPEEIREDFVKAYTLTNSRKMYAEFYIEKDRIVLLFERYKLIKTHPIIR